MKYHCDIHGIDIVDYDSEDIAFEDNNRREVSIVGGRVIRYAIGGCDTDCPTIVNIIEGKSGSSFFNAVKRFFGISSEGKEIIF